MPFARSASRDKSRQSIRSSSRHPLDRLIDLLSEVFLDSRNQPKRRKAHVGGLSEVQDLAIREADPLARAAVDGDAMDFAASVAVHSYLLLIEVMRPQCRHFVEDRSDNR